MLLRIFANWEFVKKSHPLRQDISFSWFWITMLFEAMILISRFVLFIARFTVRSFGIRRNEKIAVHCTVRGPKAEEILEKGLKVICYEQFAILHNWFWNEAGGFKMLEFVSLNNIRLIKWILILHGSVKALSTCTCAHTHHTHTHTPHTHSLTHSYLYLYLHLYVTYNYVSMPLFLKLSHINCYLSCSIWFL